MHKHFCIIMAVLFATEVLALPLPSAICEGLLSTAREHFFLQMIDEGGRTAPVRLPFDPELAPHKSRYQELQADLLTPPPQMKIYYFSSFLGPNFPEIGRPISESILSEMIHEIEHTDRMARVAVAYPETVSIETKRLANWAQHLIDAEEIDPENIYLGRYSRLVAQEDMKILGELEKIRQSFANSSPNKKAKKAVGHLMRDFIVDTENWNEALPHLAVDRQVLLDTQPLEEIPNSDEEGERSQLKIKMDMLSNATAGEVMLFVRTRPR